MFYPRLLALCAERGVKVTNVVAEMNMGSGNLSKWKAGGIPKGDTLSKLADYFQVSTDYLLGRTDDPRPAGEAEPAPASEGGLNETAQRFMPLVDKLTPDQKLLLLAQLQAWTEQNERLSPAAPAPDAGKDPESDS